MSHPLQSLIANAASTLEIVDKTLTNANSVLANIETLLKKLHKNGISINVDPTEGIIVKIRD